MRPQKTRMDVMLELLDEVDEMCRVNGLKYSISGPFAESALEGEIPKSFDYIAIAMTSGDIDRLIKIVEKEGKENRYFEYMVNNPNQVKLDGGYRYGNSATTLISASSYGQFKYYGIFIYIIEIKKKMSKPIKINIAQMRHSSYLSDGSGSSSLKKNVKKIIKKTVSEKGDEKIRKSVYNYHMNVRGIDKWEDIKNVPEVSVSKKTLVNAEIKKKAWDIVELACGEKKYMYCPALKTYKLGNKASHNIVQNLEISDTMIPFEEVLGLPLMDKVKEAQKNRKERNKITDKGKEAFKFTRRAWRTYLMSKEILGIKSDFEQARDAGDSKAVSSVLKAYKESKKDWTKRDYPFFEIEEIEELIKRGER